jgi:hypothetical protein
MSRPSPKEEAFLIVALPTTPLSPRIEIENGLRLCLVSTPTWNISTGWLIVNVAAALVTPCGSSKAQSAFSFRRWNFRAGFSWISHNEAAPPKAPTSTAIVTTRAFAAKHVISAIARTGKMHLERNPNALSDGNQPF